MFEGKVLCVMYSEIQPGFIGLDVETTGLDDDKCLLLEVALVVFDHNLVPMGSFQRVISQSPEELELALHPIAREMHVDNGLYDDVLDSNMTLEQVEAEAVDWLKRMGVMRPLPMVGSSVTFDRNVLRRVMPELFSKFHYQSVDATSVALAAKAMGVLYPADNGAEDAGSAHRALYDVMRSASLIRRVMTGVQ